MSEAIPIGVLTRLMADWFEKAQSIVELRSGRIDKFIGDCVLAKWEVVGGGLLDGIGPREGVNLFQPAGARI